MMMSRFPSSRSLELTRAVESSAIFSYCPSGVRGSYFLPLLYMMLKLAISISVTSVNPVHNAPVELRPCHFIYFLKNAIA